MKTPWPKRRLPERPVFCAALVATLFSAAGVGASHAGDRAGDVAGRYAILRDDKDTACMLTLQPGGKAQLAPACRDNGIVVFDPIAWRMEKGKLILKARKGHNLEMLRDAAGVWRRDGAEGKGLGFRTM
jgi:hypothetical protein